MKQIIKKKYKNIRKTFKRQQFNIPEVIIIMIITIVFGIFIGKITNKTIFVSESEKAVSEIANIYEELLENYYEEIDEEELINAAASGMVNYLNDKYTTYYSEDEKNELLQELAGTYKGVGIMITKNAQNQIEIIEVLKDSPAEAVGVKKSDILIMVDKQEIQDKTLEEVTQMIKNKKEVTLTIKRGEKTIDKKIIISNVTISSVSSRVIEKNNKKVGYISISLFAENTFSQFKSELLSLEENNIDSLIIDVRDNSGGHLSTVTDILELFIEEKKALYQVKSKNKNEIIYDKTSSYRTYNISILTNENSASASEILASCLKETYGAKIIGTKTYGKGTVQTTMSLSSGGMVKYTIQEWLSPKGNKINGIGVTPDVEVKLTKTDNQLDEAVNVLTK